MLLSGIIPEQPVNHFPSLFRIIQPRMLVPQLSLTIGEKGRVQFRGVKIPHAAGNAPNGDLRAGNFPRGDRDGRKIPRGNGGDPSGESPTPDGEQEGIPRPRPIDTPLLQSESLFMSRQIHQMPAAKRKGTESNDPKFLDENYSESRCPRRRRKEWLTVLPAVSSRSGRRKTPEICGKSMMSKDSTATAGQRNHIAIDDDGEEQRHSLLWQGAASTEDRATLRVSVVRDAIGRVRHADKVHGVETETRLGGAATGDS
ncbi:hypothetical protein PIB30_002018 [Stylosanthes scabra]|uniref:Uncharacterized protein n=1 Tax=Stylosanthes scabra TaxID=79078 RepID=A0ABU6Q2Q4_9FABA|nr:hypothetical protein [Stylosanthes scabra]